MPVSPQIPILVVDDFLLVAATIAGMLRMEGFEDVAVAHGGAQAIEMMATRTYSLVISDLRMPDVDGLQLLDSITWQSDVDATRFLLVSGHICPSDIPALKQRGVDAVVLKPFSPASLMQAINDAFVSAAAAA